MGPFHQYFDFHAALERLFGRSVDLVEQSAIRNPYFRQAVDHGQRVLLYVA
jgi:predicted nucleotidyltransferase